MENPWYKIEERQPPCDSQHSHIFLSEEVLTYNGYDMYTVCRYAEYYTSGEGGFKLIKKGFFERGEELDVEYWQQIKGPDDKKNNKTI